MFQGVMSSRKWFDCNNYIAANLQSYVQFWHSLYAMFVDNCRTPSLRTPSNYFVINLAFSDAAFSLINGFPLMSIACFQRGWMWGQIGEWNLLHMIRKSEHFSVIVSDASMHLLRWGTGKIMVSNAVRIWHCQSGDAEQTRQQTINRK